MTSRTGSDLSDAVGFTLIEVLVATVVVLAGILAIVGVLGKSVSVLDECSQAIGADSLLREKIGEVEESALLGKGLPSSSAGDFSSVGKGFRWQLEVRPPALTSAGGKRLKEFVLTVWKASSQRRYMVSTYVGEHGN
jgi:type II secretory pathway pseudopilin PulG